MTLNIKLSQNTAITYYPNQTAVISHLENYTYQLNSDAVYDSALCSVALAPTQTG